MFKAIRSIASKLFQGFLKAAKKTGRGTVKVLEALGEAADTSIVYEVQEAESRLNRRGTFGNVVGALVGDEQVTRDIAIVRDRKAYATYVQDRRAGKADAYAVYSAQRSYFTAV